MSNVTEFPDPNGPDPEFVKVDDYGRKMYFYAATYEYQGGDWSIEFWAYGMGDAVDRLSAMRKSAGKGDPNCFQILRKISA